MLDELSLVPSLVTDQDQTTVYASTTAPAPERPPGTTVQC